MENDQYLMNEMDEMDETNYFYNIIQNKIDESSHKDKIKLIRNKNVFSWLYGNIDFLKKFCYNNKISELKKAEDEWGKKIMENSKTMWSGVFGETVCKELLLLLDIESNKPLKKCGIKPDLETNEYIIEVKNGTYFTNGTAHEKILGVPYKYRNILEVYNKPLFIVCFGRAEKYIKKLGLIDYEQENEFIQLYNKKGIYFIGFKDLIKKITQ